MTEAPRTPGEARLVRVSGLVQGVGFRPTVWHVARVLGLMGEVFNDPQGVGIRLEGSREALDAFPDALRRAAPPLSRIDALEVFPAEWTGFSDFTIAKSDSAGAVTTMITPDAATCPACLADIFNPAGRRARYAFTNCTHCGPRFTITRALPYDRPQTAMSVFPMCPECLKEYEDPADRRFHAQPNACPVCGPQLSLADTKGNPLSGDPIRRTAAVIRQGGIAAVKGIGGFHLVCDARNAEAVARLRARKGRSEKPLALMAANAESLAGIVHVSEAEAKMLGSPEHPIVLLRKDPACPPLPGIADGLDEIGVMLPYTPLHALLFHALEGEPEDPDWLGKKSCQTLLVMTSANPGGEPLVIGNDEAFERLGAIADVILSHNREILVRCDDSVVRFPDGEPLWVRRGRGVTPEAIVPAAEASGAASAASAAGTIFSEPVLAAGSFLKNAAALTRGSEIFLTQHIGDLENLESCQALELAVEHLGRIIAAEPKAAACDLHPDFFSTRLAEKIAAERGIPLVRIAHHAAHVGAVMAEAGRAGRTLGLAMDGVGLGPDGGVWGGELLACSPEGFERIGSLEALALPGGDRAAREPWRMGAALLAAIGRDDLRQKLLASPDGKSPEPWMLDAIPKLIASPSTVRTSALGRWFDAASALLGLCLVQHDEATAAMRLEASAAPVLRTLSEAEILAPFDVRWTIEGGVLSLAPFWQSFADYLAAGRDAGRTAQAAAAFELTLVRALADWTGRLTADDPDRSELMLSGGCFLNRTLAAELPKHLQALGIHARLPRKSPPGDGGLAVGQAWLARLALGALGTDIAEYPFIGDRVRRTEPA